MAVQDGHKQFSASSLISLLHSALPNLQPWARSKEEQWEFWPELEPLLELLGDGICNLFNKFPLYVP